MVNYRIIVLGLLSMLLFQVSCISNKKVVYMQKLSPSALISKGGKLIPYKTENYLLQYNDVVDITMTTSDPELNILLNTTSSLEQMRMLGGNMMGGGDVFYLNGFTVNDLGIVELPMIGKIKLVGLTTDEAKLTVESELKKYVLDNEYFVRVRLGGIRYSAIGEFVRPGKYTILQNRVTIFEAIANAGDLTTVAKRSAVRVIRQYPNGSRAHIINLNNDEIMNSEFYFLKPNDMIYAEPMKVRELGTGVTLVQTTQLLISLATVGLLVFTATK